MGDVSKKGIYGEQCNITRCVRDGAKWFNRSTLKYYCGECAQRLNNDEYNQRDTLRLFGVPNICYKVENPILGVEEVIKIDILIAFGWNESYGSTWLKSEWYTDGKHNVNYCGLSLDDAFEQCYYEN